MRIVKVLYYLIGFALLAVVVAKTDLTGLWQQTAQIGYLGIAVVLGLYLLAFIVDSITWALTLVHVPVNLKWVRRTLAVRLVGESFNNVIPAGGMGGEPVKAMLLKQHYGIGYMEGAASIILAKTINMIALCLFLIMGFALMIASESLTPLAKQIAGVGLLAMLGATLTFFLIQRLRLTSLSGTWLSGFSFAARIEKILTGIYAFDEHVVKFYTVHRARFLGATLLALLNWLIGIAEIYYAMQFLGHPISWTDAYIIEAVTQMVRSGTFFIPLSLGAQEGAFVVIVQMITGSPTLGLALGIVRRLRELIWIAAGFLIGAWFSFRLKKIAPDPN